MRKYILLFTPLRISWVNKESGKSFTPPRTRFNSVIPILVWIHFLQIFNLMEKWSLLERVVFALFAGTALSLAEVLEIWLGPIDVGFGTICF